MPTWVRGDDWLPLVEDGGFPPYIDMPVALDYPACRRWSVPIYVPALSICYHLEVEAGHPLAAYAEAEVWLRSHWASFIEQAIKQRQHLLRN